MQFLGHDFQYQSQGTILVDPGHGTKDYEPNWMILLCDEQISHYYRWHLKRWGLEALPPNSLWGFHVSVIKGEEPLKNKDLWSQFNNKVIDFHYGNYVSYTNGRHAWINCYSEQLTDIRDFYGLNVNGRKLKYHMTLGRLKIPTQPDIKRPGTVYKDGSEEFATI